MSETHRHVFMRQRISQERHNINKISLDHTAIIVKYT